MSTELELNCWVVGNEPYRIFPVKIQSSESVGTLKEEIKKKNPDIDCPADTLILWKNVNEIEEDDLLKLNRDVRGNIPGAERLDARRRLWKVFTETPEDEAIHIFVQRPAPATLSPPLSARSGRSHRSIHAGDAGVSGAAKLRRDFDRFHSENGVRTVLGSIGPVSNVRMLLKSGYRHVYISRKFAMKNGFIPSDAAPGNYGYSGLINLGRWPITLKTAADFAETAQTAGAPDTVPSSSHSRPSKSKTVTVPVFLSEEPHFDVVLGRSFFEKRQIKISSIDPTEVICLDTGEKIECELVILKDGRGEIVIVT